jgi:hypothetical protein
MLSGFWWIFLSTEKSTIFIFIKLKNMQQQDLIGYDEIIENSMRLVIYETLKKVEKTGLPGNHYFVLTFITKAKDVSISQELLEKYPEEMTIVIQFQFKNLVVEKDKFKISLSFSGKDEKLVIPYSAINSFSDPSMSFALKFSVNYDEIKSLENGDFGESNQANRDSSSLKAENSVDLSAKVVSLDAFRKNKGNKDK